VNLVSHFIIFSLFLFVYVKSPVLYSAASRQTVLLNLHTKEKSVD
jgi:hypothetical protein